MGFNAAFKGLITGGTLIIIIIIIIIITVRNEYHEYFLGVKAAGA